MSLQTIPNHCCDLADTMNTVILIGLIVCVSGAAYASALPADATPEARAELGPVEEIEAETLEGQENRRYGGGRYYGGGYGRGYGYGGGYGRGYGGGGYGQGYGGGYGRGYGYGGGYGRGWGRRR